MPLPQFDAANPKHVEMAELGLACEQAVRKELSWLDVKNYHVGRVRVQVNKALVSEKIEIDRIVRQLIKKG